MVQVDARISQQTVAFYVGHRLGEQVQVVETETDLVDRLRQAMVVVQESALFYEILSSCG